ncbi:MAG: 23S rRNA (adenine(2503)-C(2))-methyltransferase RlmN [Oscillospiraceae bacterium]|nr:23S rRNA (adenine(2503)-C(2))-methyltransferase RlmN [Oscillospiraceae bacterium]
MKQDIKSMTLPQLEGAMEELGEKKFRAKQIFQWLGRGAECFEDMTNLSKQFRQKLDENFYLYAPQVVRRQESQRDGTMKYLWRLRDGNCVETVLMQYRYGNTVCVSTEVGCAMGCAFCASTQGGLVRRLTAGEILDQVIFTQKDSGKKISRIVLMGIGEPLDNFDAVMQFLELVNHPDGVGISMRHISLSTCGLAERIDKLASLHLQLTLSVSLHAPDDETRSKIMPVNRKYNVQRLMESCRKYYQETGRRISFEYAMIRGVNDTPRHAEMLIRQTRGMDAHVNMIPLNHVEGSSLVPSTKEDIRRFQQQLEQAGITATVRRSLGGDIDASCGQLRKKQLQQEEQG